MNRYVTLTIISAVPGLILRIYDIDCYKTKELINENKYFYDKKINIFKLYDLLKY